MTKVEKKPSITSKELVDTLMLVSETAKALAQEVMLIPAENGGKDDGNNSD